MNLETTINHIVTKEREPRSSAAILVGVSGIDGSGPDLLVPNEVTYES